MGHVLDTGSRGVVADENIIAIIIVNRRVSIHNLGQYISTDFGEISAEQDSNVGLKPAKAWHELMDTPDAIPFEQCRFIQQVHDVGFLIADIGNRPKSEILVQVVFNTWISLAQGDVHLDGTLAVSDVDEFLVGVVVHILEHSRQVKISHMLERKLPKCSILVRVVLYMFTRVLVASAVAQPDVVSRISQDESWCLIFVVDNPSVRRVQESVLQEYWFQPFFELRTFLLNSENSQDIPILGCDIVDLGRVVVVPTIVGEVELGFRVLLGQRNYCEDHESGDHCAFH